MRALTRSRRSAGGRPRPASPSASARSRATVTRCPSSSRATASISCSAGALLRSAGLVVEQVHGVRVIADLLPGAVLEGQYEALLAFELAVSAEPPYRDVASQLHLFARKPA